MISFKNFPVFINIIKFKNLIMKLKLLINVRVKKNYYLRGLLHVTKDHKEDYFPFLCIIMSKSYRLMVQRKHVGF